jgi:ribosomal protein S18 acetylase RimI-like enzyme
VKDSVCEITSLASALEGKGIGTKLVDEAVRAAKENSCSKVILETTNDNINALRFYQKRGFDMVRIRRNSMEEARKMKPGIPLTGKNGIPLKHNIEFEMCLG